MKIIFYGSDYYSTIVLKELITLKQEVVLVVTSKQKPRLPFPFQSVYEICLNTNIPYCLISDKNELLSSQNTLESSRAEIGLVASFGYILPPEIFNIPQHGTLNIHPSLLPKYRGPTPLQQTILNKDEIAGVSLIQIDEGIDTGIIICQATITNSPSVTTTLLAQNLFQRGVELFVETITTNPNGDFAFFEQASVETIHSSVTFLIDNNKSEINWQRPPQEIQRKISAFFPKPIAWSNLGKTVEYLSVDKQIPARWYTKKTKIFSSRIYKNKLVPQILQVEGKKIVSYAEFNQGYLQ